jgi:hypothetical protein
MSLKSTAFGKPCTLCASLATQTKLILIALMKTIKFAGYLLYRYYSKGDWHDIPYFTTLCSMTLLGYLHLTQLLIILNKIDLIPTEFSDNIWIKRLIICLVMLPIYIIMSRLFRRKDIDVLKKKYDNNQTQIRKGNIWLIVYAIMSFALIFILIYSMKTYEK